MADAETHAAATRPGDARDRRFRRLTGRIFLAQIVGALAAFFLLPIALRLGAPGDLAWLLLPLALLANGYWATLHEAIHGHLFADGRRNRWGGRLLAILWGSSFRFLRFGHLSHHRFNRHPLDRPDWFDPRAQGALAARARFYAELLGGLYLLEVAVPMLFLLPKPWARRLLARVFAGEAAPLPVLRSLAAQNLGSDRAIAEIRNDALGVLAACALAILAWGPYWPAFALFLLGRGFFVSFLDNVYHFRTPIDRPDFAYNLALPGFLQAFILNMNLHRVHHRHMSLPWWRLSGHFAALGEHCEAPLWRMALRQFRGPLPQGEPKPAGLPVSVR